jgi:hypothetical protein
MERTNAIGDSLAEQANLALDAPESNAERKAKYSISAGGVSIPFYEIDEHRYAGAPPTIIIASSTSGKTSILMDILHALRKKISSILMFTGTSGATDGISVASIVNPMSIRDTLDVPLIRRFYDLAKKSDIQYKNATNYATLSRVIKQFAGERLGKCQDSASVLAKIQESEAVLEAGIKKLEPAIRDSVGREMTKVFQKNMVRLMRKYFQLHGKHELPGQIITSEDREVIDWCSKHEPVSVLIFDDFSSELQQALPSKKSGLADMFMELFSTGRHFNIVTIISIHAPNILPNQLRNIAGRYILCNEASVNAIVTGGKNAIVSKELGARLIETARQVYRSEFREDDRIRRFRKIIYCPTIIQGTKIPSISVTTATPRVRFEIGNEEFRAMMRFIENLAKKKHEDDDTRERDRLRRERDIKTNIRETVQTTVSDLRRIR